MNTGINFIFPFIPTLGNLLHWGFYKFLKICLYYFLYFYLFNPFSMNLKFKGIGFTLLYFKMAVILLVSNTKIADVGKLISLGEPIGQESHVVCANNYVCNFDFVPLIWSRLHDKDCLYILSSSKNSFFPLWLP